jgi:hypothetical protein
MPIRELRQVLNHMARIRVKDMRTVLVHQYACSVHFVVGISPDMRSSIHNQYGFSGGGEALRNDTTGKTGSDNQHIYILHATLRN